MKICINKRSYKVSFLEKLGIKPFKLKTVIEILKDTPVEKVRYYLHDFFYTGFYSPFLWFTVKTSYREFQDSLAREACMLIEKQVSTIPHFISPDLVYLLAQDAPGYDLQYQPDCLQLAITLHDRRNEVYISLCNALVQQIKQLCPLWLTYFEQEAKGDWQQINMLETYQLIDSSAYKYTWPFQAQTSITLKHVLNNLREHEKILLFQGLFADYCHNQRNFDLVQQFCNYVNPRMARMFTHYAYLMIGYAPGRRQLTDDIIMDPDLAPEDKNYLLADILEDFTEEPSFQEASLRDLCTDYEFDPLWGISIIAPQLSYSKDKKQKNIYDMYSTMFFNGKLSFHDLYVRTRKYSAGDCPMAITFEYGFLDKKDIFGVTLDILSIENQVNEKVSGYNYINGLSFIWEILRHTILRPDDFVSEVSKALRTVADLVEEKDPAEWYNAMFLRFLASKRVCGNADLLSSESPDPQQLKMSFARYLKKHL